jgi:hypothetical protein
MVSLKQAYEQGSLRLAFYCRRPMPHGFCDHVGKLSIESALKRWGGEIAIGAIPARCGKCGSSEFVSVMGEPPGRLASAATADPLRVKETL